MKINIGKNSGMDVYFDTEISLNKHVVSIGKSGGGKSVQNQRIMTEIIRNGGTVLAFDYHQTLADEEIFVEHKDFFKKHVTDVDVYESGIQCPLFTPVTFADGSHEKTIDTVGSVVEIISRQYDLKCRQQATLRSACETVEAANLYYKQGISAIAGLLKADGSDVAKGVSEKIYSLTAHNIFRDGKLFLKNNAINVVRLSKLDLKTQVVVTEIVLWYLWRLAATMLFRDTGLFIYLDESQNLSSGPRSILAQILSEGRKFNLNLLLATQLLSLNSSQEAKRLLMQCGLIQFFQPSVKEIKATADIIDHFYAEKWCSVLSVLEKGEFVAMGQLIINGKLTDRALKVSARSDC